MYKKGLQVEWCTGWPPHRSAVESREVTRTVFANDHVWALVEKSTGCINWLSELYRGDERPVRVMRLDYCL